LNTPRLHTVCVVGAAADVAARVTALLDEQRTKLDARWRAADHAHAELLVIDADSVYGHMDWLKASSSGRLVAACTNSPEGYDTQYWLRHPIVAADLVALLNRAGAQIEGKPLTPVAPVREATPEPKAAPARAPAAPVAATPAAPAPATPVRVVARPPTPVVAEPAPVAIQAASTPARGIQLLDLLEPNAPLKGRLRLAADGLPTLLLEPNDRNWHSTSSGLKALTGWCTRSLNPEDVHHLDYKEFAAEVAAQPAQPYSRLQWLAHLVRGDGHLDADLDVNGRYKLSRWPQSEREFPKHFRIATVMLKQAATLGEIAEQGGATIGDVANFINAYHAVGFIEHDGAERAQESAGRGGLFGRMRKTSAN
jgi:hypothetical protein